MKYVLDSNVCKKFASENRNANVDKWLSTVNDSDIYITSLTVLESQKGIELLRKTGKPDKVEIALAIEHMLDELLVEFEERILPVDVSAAREWG